MVWFQCEDCGENLKKPKLSNHFRICCASKLSCIDCGEIFGQQNVQSHTQCITEAEKYGPKGEGKVSNGMNAKSNKESKQQPDIDINVGLSERPPWFCSLCNTKATSKQTLLLHSEGKKHKSKARAYHAANQQAKQTEAAPEMKVSTGELANDKHVEEPKVQNLSKEAKHIDPDTLNVNLPSPGKRKHHASEKDGAGIKTGSNTPVEAVNGEVIQAEKEKPGDTERSSKRAKHNVLIEETENKIKWKKLITSALKSTPDGVLKLKKLKKLVLKALQESGIQEDETQLSNVIEYKIDSSSRFIIDGKYVRVAAKE
ncbi:hypothetical protein AB3S75_019578 [Citrus x aurantiifolia]